MNVEDPQTWSPIGRDLKVPFGLANAQALFLGSLNLLCTKHAEPFSWLSVDGSLFSRVTEEQGLHVRNDCLTNQKGLQRHLKDRNPDKPTDSFNLTGFNSSFLFLCQFYCGKEVWAFCCLSLLWYTGVPRVKYFPRAAAHLHGIPVNIVYDLGHHLLHSEMSFPNQMWFQCQ